MADYPEPPSQLSESYEARTFGLGLHNPETPSDTDDQPVGEIKRPRACEPCRQLKVRCDPESSNPDGACKRCAKARRQYIVTEPTRKRQKKTDSRVTELERKIDALTATIQASHHTQLTMGTIPGTVAGVQQTQPQSSRDQPSNWLRGDQNMAGNKRHHDGFLVAQYPRPNSPSAEQITKQPAKHWRGPFEGETKPGPKADVGNDFVDVIDRGMIDIATAQASFNHYVSDMGNDMPFVVMAPGTTMGQVRREKPTLFLAILGVSVGIVKKDLQMPLINESYRLIAEKVVVKGHKSLELVQALLVVSIWYMTPDNLEELKFYQLIHMAIVVGMEVGLNRRSNGDMKIVRIREIVIKRKTPANAELDTPEARRAWVGCYFLGIQAAIALRRIQIVRWQPYMDESLQILENHPDALPSDRQAVWWGKLGWIMEQAGLQLTTDDTQSIVSFTDSKVRYTIKAFSNQLAQFRRDIPEELWSPTLAHTYHALDLFIHESVMGVDCRDSIFPEPEDEGLDDDACMAPIIEALTSCLNSIHRSFDTILSIDVERVRYLPTLALARTAYPVVSLIKIYSLVTAPDSHIGRLMDARSLKVEYYLNRVITHYRAAAALEGGRVAGKFGNIIMMLRDWFLKKRENGPELREIFGAEMHNPRETQPPRQGTTPLQVLSDLAMGDPRSTNPTQPANSNQGSVYSSSTINQDMARNPPTPATSYGTVETSTHWSPAPYTPQMSTGSHDSGMGDRSFYQPFTPNQPQQYIMPGTTQYPQMPGLGSMPPGQPMGLPELTAEAPFDPSLAILGTMMDEGLLSFPYAFDGNFQL
ncbi:Transcription factor [Penicillium verhagenii]|uniref:Transcription factor n=1 Tax=Penicillium verhagenii TaxID=1562060 RepID=UPI0025452959|nr:Transcription factor [Penicillium verhagenii]KAJ5935801.1 Transcription factor [Penicillium verhagenii]